MRNIRKIIISTICITIFTSVIVSAAYFTSQDKVTNKFGVGNIKGTIDEGDFKDLEEWIGQAVDKRVTIKNESNIPVLVRVSLQPRWIDENKKPWVGDISIVDLNLNSDNVKEDIFVTENSIESLIIDSWVYGDDGYYYYSSILNPTSQIPNQSTEILSSVEINSAKFNVLPDKEAYYGKELIVDVKSEVIQVNSGAWKTVWGENKLSEEVKKLLGELTKGL